MFDKFTDRARRVMALARKEAQRFNHDFIGTEHILLGIIEETSCTGCNILKNLVTDITAIARSIEKGIKYGPKMILAGQLPFTPRVKEVLELAIDFADRKKHQYIGTEDLLYGLVCKSKYGSENMTSVVLEDFGVTPDLVEKEMDAILGTQPTESTEKKEKTPEVINFEFPEEFEEGLAVYYEEMDRRSRLKPPFAMVLKTEFKNLKDGDKFISPDPELNEKGKHFLFVKSEDASVRGSGSWNAFRPSTGQHYGFRPDHEVVRIE